MMAFLYLVLLFTVFASTEQQKVAEEKCKEYGKAVYGESAVALSNRGKESTCGIVSTPLIVGGEKAKEKEFPHMAVIGFGQSATGELKWMCGGSLISDLYILTAAHCASSLDYGPAQKVRLGFINMDNLGSNLQEKAIAEIVKHPKFQPPQKYNDVALIKMDGPVKFSAYVRPACLNTAPPEPNSAVIASGFGKLAYDGANVGSPDLMKVQLSVIQKSTCSETVAKGAANVLKDGITEEVVCAGELKGGKDTCQGDSGGPLQTVRKDPHCMYDIVGVTSFGKFCGFANSPAIYMKVASYVPWIEGIVWK